MSHTGYTTTISIAAGGTYSTSFSLPHRDSFVGLFIPDITAGSVGLEVSSDNGSNYYPVLDIVDGQDMVICANNSDPGFIDISDLLKALPTNALIRITCAAQAAAVTITVSFRY